MSVFPLAPGVESNLCVSPEIIRILDDAEEKINKEDMEKTNILTKMKY